MIGKKDNKATSTLNAALNVIGEGTEISGDLISSGDVRVDGVIKGKVISKSRFVLGVSGRVEGDIQARNADISGSIKGNVEVQEILYLKSSGRINGDILTDKLVVESGGAFNGKCVMNSSGKSALNDRNESAPKAVNA